MTALRIDTAEFTRRGDVAEGRLDVAALERLASLLESPQGVLQWRLQGRDLLRPDGSREGFLRLACRATVTLRCVRCLEPMPVELAVSRDYRLVASEDVAERDDLDDDAYDVLVGGRSFDLGELIEDEAILAVPGAPRHDDCRVAAPAAEHTEPGTRRPFEVLGRLRRAGGDG